MKNKCSANFGRGYLFVLMDRVSRSIIVADPGEGPAPLSFRPNWGPKGRKTFFTDHPRLSKGLDDRPPYLRVWIRHWINSLLGDNRTKLPTGEIGSQSEKQYLPQLAHLRKPPYNTVSLETRRRLYSFLYRFLQFFILLSFFTSPVYHYTRFWNLLWELSVKLEVCSLESLSCRIISRNRTKSGDDVFQVYSIFFSRDHPRLIIFFISWMLLKIALNCMTLRFTSETLRSKFFGISR